MCPFCASLTRHRALTPLIAGWLSQSTREVSALHIAPDACIRSRLKDSVQSYRGLDRFEPGHYYPPDTIHGDLQNLPLPDDSIDLSICLHVLEHVDDDLASLASLFRVAKPGGVVVLAFPFRGGRLTFEDRSITDPAQRAALFGQWDHVRVYGDDAKDRMRSAGFDVIQFKAADIYDAGRVQSWGLRPGEVFFVCRKPGGVSALANASLPAKAAGREPA